MEKPTVRIVILNYNGSEMTLNLVRQLKHQTFQNFETIVVDNASRESEQNILKQNLPENTVLIESKKNLGYSAGNNLGMRHKSEQNIDYHLILNNDILIEDTNYIQKMIDGMLLYKDKNVVASSSLIYLQNSVPKEKEFHHVRKILSFGKMYCLMSPFLNLFIKLFARKITNEYFYKSQMPYTNQYMICDTINGAGFIIDAAFMKENGYLDEGTFLYCEEIILGRQIKNKNKHCLLNGFTSVEHFQGVSTKSNPTSLSPKMERYKYKSALYYFKKYDNLGFLGSQVFILSGEISILLKKIKEIFRK
ncbi:MAG: glycosyltransferase family 2 protein [Flavobacteriaceae bacterium]|jgi:GT2 family glycosyltransferase|nr:glycosyltransferase family 2 protein [Flavobacteriaceae bacterium]